MAPTWWVQKQVRPPLGREGALSGQVDCWRCVLHISAHLERVCAVLDAPSSPHIITPSGCQVSGAAGCCCRNHATTVSVPAFRDLHTPPLPHSETFPIMHRFPPNVSRRKNCSMSRYDLDYCNSWWVTIVSTCWMWYRWCLCSVMSGTCRETNGEKNKNNQSNSTILPINSCFSASLRLLKQQLQDCKLAIQPQHSSLEDRYSGMEAAMETLRKQNMCLQDMLEQVNSHCSTQLGSTSRPQQHRWRC